MGVVLRILRCLRGLGLDWCLWVWIVTGRADQTGQFISVRDGKAPATAHQIAAHFPAPEPCDLICYLRAGVDSLPSELAIQSSGLFWIQSHDGRKGRAGPTDHNNPESFCSTAAAGLWQLRTGREMTALDFGEAWDIVQRASCTCGEGSRLES